MTARNKINEPLQQRSNQIRLISKGSRNLCSRARATDDIDQERRRKGMSVCQRHHLVEQVDIDPFDCRSTSIPSTASSVRMCVADRLRSKITRSISRQPGSESHAASGGLRLAMTTTESAGTAGKNSSRSQSSADPPLCKVKDDQGG